jgi:ATP synthase protein I
MASQGRETLRLITQFSAGTLELGVSVAVGVAIGYGLDRLLGTAPWFTLFWLLAGLVAGFRSLIRVAKKLSAEEGREDRDGNSY